MTTCTYKSVIHHNLLQNLSFSAAKLIKRNETTKEKGEFDTFMAFPQASPLNLSQTETGYGLLFACSENLFAYSKNLFAYSKFLFACAGNLFAWAVSVMSCSAIHESAFQVRKQARTEEKEGVFDTVVLPNRSEKGFWHGD